MSTAWSEPSRRPDFRRAPGHWPLAVAAALFVAVLATDLVDFGAYQLRYELLNAGSPSSWSHHVTAVMFAAGAVSCSYGALRDPRRRASWSAAAVVLAFLFVDEITSLHAEVDTLNHGKLLYVPALLLLVACLAQLTAGGAYAANLRIAMVVLALAYAIHVSGPEVHAPGLGCRRLGSPGEGRDEGGRGARRARARAPGRSGCRAERTGADRTIARLAALEAPAAVRVRGLLAPLRWRQQHRGARGIYET